MCVYIMCVHVCVCVCVHMSQCIYAVCGVCVSDLLTRDSRFLMLIKGVFQA